MSGHEYCKHHNAYDWLTSLPLLLTTTLLGRSMYSKFTFHFNVILWWVVTEIKSYYGLAVWYTHCPDYGSSKLLWNVTQSPSREPSARAVSPPLNARLHDAKLKQTATLPVNVVNLMTSCHLVRMYGADRQIASRFSVMNWVRWKGKSQWFTPHSK
jgi:hypothetical protein